MESESDMPAMQSKAWQKYIRGKNTPLIGQAKLFNRAMGVEARSGETHLDRVVFPTGYGKTLAGMGTYLIYRGRGIVNRALVTVPNDDLRETWALEAQENAEFWGSSIIRATKEYAGLKVTGITSDYRNHESGKAEIFVASYQGICRNPSFYGELLATGSWQLINDEFHRLSEDRAWGRAIRELMRQGNIAVATMLSATPIRTDREHTIAGCYQPDGDAYIFVPDVQVTLREARDEQAIREPRGHIGHYGVDVIPPGQDTAVHVTTELLRKEGIKDMKEFQEKYGVFNVYEARKELRLDNKYIAQQVHEALDLYDAKNARHSGQHQILGFGMGCDHIKMLAQQFNTVAGDGFADWVGVARPSQEENKAIIQRFKDGTLPCLLNVDMFGEGSNNVRASIVVDFSIIYSDTKNLQRLGRGLRRNRAIAKYSDDVCDVIASADTEMARLITDLEVELECEQKKEGGDGGDPWPLFREPLGVTAEHEWTQFVTPSGSTNGDTDAELQDIIAYAVRVGMPMEIAKSNPEWLRQAVKGYSANLGTERPRQSNPLPVRSAEQPYRDRVKHLTSTFVRKAGELYIKTQGGDPKTATPKDLKSALYAFTHDQWIKGADSRRSDGMMEHEFKPKFDWLNAEYETMKHRREVPPWLKAKLDRSGVYPARQNGSNGLF